MLPPVVHARSRAAPASIRGVGNPWVFRVMGHILHLPGRAHARGAARTEPTEAGGEDGGEAVTK